MLYSKIVHIRTFIQFQLNLIELLAILFMNNNKSVTRIMPLTVSN